MLVEGNFTTVHGKSCREKEAKLRQAKAALATKQAGAKRLERAFQAVHAESAQLVRSMCHPVPACCSRKVSTRQATAVVKLPR